MRKILLSPIGRSPGAVTGIYYALAGQDPPVTIDAVVLISTAMDRVRQAADIVTDELGSDKVHILRLRTEGSQLSHDFDDRTTMLDFIHQTNAVLSHARRAGDEVYIGISGGRSSMGALATLSAYIYGAAGIYHLWVDEDVEALGDVSKLPALPSKRKAILSPAPDKCKLLAIPLASFDELWDRGRLGKVLAERPAARDALLRAVTDVEMKQIQALQKQQQVSFDDAACRVREVFKNTELERAVEAAIKLSDPTVTTQDLIAQAEKLEAYFPAPLWVQIKDKLGDLKTWTSGADRLLKTVEAIGQPLAVAGLALMFGIPK